MPILGVVASSMKGAPGIPTVGTATDVGTGRAYNNGAATVTFTPAAGATATSFTATSSPGGFTGTAASSPITVAGLQSSVSYTFTVTATNASGTSAASAASNSITATTVPQAPTIGSATDGGTGTTVNVAFTGNATGGKTVTGYTATSTPGSITGTNTSSPITVSGLTSGTSYTFTVTATNANGTSAASAASNSVTPLAPTSYDLITESYGGATSITFSGIPQTYSRLILRGAFALPSGYSGYMYLRINNATSATSYYYYYTNQYNNSTSVVRNVNDSIFLANNQTIQGNYVRCFEIEIPNYTSTAALKGMTVLTSCVFTDASVAETNIGSATFNSTSAITSVNLYTNSTQPLTGGRFQLLGIKDS